MKTIQRGIFSGLFSFICFCSFAVTKTWIGPAIGNWNTGTNWMPAGVPAPGDDVIFNTSASVSIDVASPVDLNSIHFISNCVVVFECNSTKNFRLASTSLLNPALLIEAGSVFTFDATNIAGTNNSTLDLTTSPPPGAVGQIDGILNISCSGGVANGPKLDTYNSLTNYGVVTINSGGRIRILPDADNTESSLIPVPTIIMANGSVYENLKNGGSFPEGNWAPNSLARALSAGTVGPSFNGLSYGNLEWNCPAQTAISFLNADVSFNNVDFINTNNGAFRVKTGASAGVNTMTINGNLTVSSLSVLETTGNSVTGVNGGRIHLKGNLLNQGMITEGGPPGTVNELELNGTINQTITNNFGGILSGDELLFIMNNPAGATLLSPLTLPYNLTLTNGIITTSAVNPLTMINNAVVTGAGGSVTSFIQGPMKKIGDDDFTFPVGEGGIYAPIGISGGINANVADIFTAQYFRQSPQVTFGTVYDGSFDHISYVEYWTLTRDAGVATKLVSLKVNDVSFATQESTLRVVRHNGAMWINADQFAFVPGLPVPPYITGTITGIEVTNFGPFTLASTVAAPINPLPVFFTSFMAQKNNNDALLNWKLSETPAPTISFDIERSADGRNFKKTGTVNAANTNEYRFTDVDLPAGISWYRIKAKDPSGKIALSEIAAIVNEEKGIYIIRVYPNPVKDIAKLKIAAAKSSVTRLIVTGMNGKIVKRFELFIPKGGSVIALNLCSLPAGIYFIGTPETSARAGYVMIIKQ
jgi:hypothetical protein